MFYDANLTAKCPAMRQFDGTTSDDANGAYLELVAQYKDCRRQHNALVDALPTKP